MSKRQIKKVARLEQEIDDCNISINGLETIIERNSEEIDRIKNGGVRRHRDIAFEIGNDF